MIVVSDTSPLLSLALIGRLDLLQQLYASIVIPGAVRAEIVASDQGGAREVAVADWITTQAVDQTIVVKLLLREVDRGEAEAIALAIQTQAELLLLDERKARSVAVYLDLHVAGLLDVLHAAKQRHLIAAIKPVLDDLVAHANFRLSRKLYLRTLHAAGELDDAHPA